MTVKFSNGLTITCASMAEARRFLSAAVRGLKIVSINGKAV